MKGIIIVDKKNDCLDCQFCREIQEGIEACCELTIDEKDSELFKMIDADYCQEIPEWCPINPMPEKMKVREKTASIGGIFLQGRETGWNDCVDYILGGGKDEKEKEIEESTGNDTKSVKADQD